MNDTDEAIELFEKHVPLLIEKIDSLRKIRDLVVLPQLSHLTGNNNHLNENANHDTDEEVKVG